MNKKTRFTAFYMLLLLSAGILYSARNPAPGVEQSLAIQRKSWISKPEYLLKAVIPENKDEPIQAELALRFSALHTNHDLILDFTPGAGAIQTIQLNDSAVDWRFANEHIIIPKEALQTGLNELDFVFQLGNAALNRRDDLLYTLFVPERARTAFPCFDQPDIKGRFAVVLDIPAHWHAVANGPLLDERVIPDGRKLLQFKPSHPLPTYLMAFAAGDLKQAEESRNGRRIGLFHQENDVQAFERNRDDIFDQVFASLEWMENYTGIPYPFDKYDLILVPSFQYGGMEHCGATLYRASRLILDENATLEQHLSRAGLIAHETAHMWFGDLVTMPWFDEVWLKEVFAGFMADKMVKELFPDIDHALRFLLSHTPPALSIDRSKGTHPVTQPLNNLADAGTLYGHLIYHKAPIVMNQLEKRVGKEPLRKALNVYLNAWAYDSAGWDPLIDLLSENDPELKTWSRGWIYEPGLPVITVIRHDDHIKIMQTDESGHHRLWDQQIAVLVQKDHHAAVFEIQLDEAEKTIRLPDEYQNPDLILPAANGAGYGRILPDMKSLAVLLAHPMLLDKPLWRGAARLALWESAIAGYIKPESLLNSALDWMETETDPLLLEKAAGDIPEIFWRLLSPQQREKTAECAENRIWQEMLRRPENQRMSFFNACLKTGSSAEMRKKWMDVLTGSIQIAGVTLSEQKELDILIQLGVFSDLNASALLDELPANWQSGDRKGQIRFLRPLFSAEPEQWTRFFRTVLTKPENRQREPWALLALSMIHHPVRSEKTRELICETLAMLSEIQRTGDIFFPARWIESALSGHQSPEAARMARQFLKESKDLSAPLRLKVLQGADFLLRQNNTDYLRIRERIEALSSLPRPRNAANPDMLEKAAAIISRQFEEQGWHVRSQNIPYPEGMTRNISVIWGDEKAKRLVIGAHYDVCGNTPGADDNASGAAVILELASRLKSRMPHKKLAVELIAYTLEEPPYFGTRQMGSYFHAASLKKAGIDVPLMMSVDMVGYYADENSFLGIVGQNEDRHMLEKTADLLSNQTMLAPEAVPLALSFRGVDWSDHRNFWFHDYNALMMTIWPLTQNPWYHKPEDTSEKLDYARIHALVNALEDIIINRGF